MTGILAWSLIGCSIKCTVILENDFLKQIGFVVFLVVFLLMTA